MADLNVIRSALASQVSAGTGLRAQAQVRDQISPPVALILPGSPLITYGDTMQPDNALTINLVVMVILSDAPPVEKTQRALDVLLGLGAGESQSIPASIMLDSTLNGVVEWCMPTAVTSYSRVEWNSVTYFGARLNVTIGTR